MNLFLLNSAIFITYNKKNMFIKVGHKDAQKILPVHCMIEKTKRFCHPMRLKQKIHCFESAAIKFKSQINLFHEDYLTHGDTSINR